jgi:hypothetical protein
MSVSPYIDTESFRIYQSIPSISANYFVAFNFIRFRVVAIKLFDNIAVNKYLVMNFLTKAISAKKNSDYDEYYAFHINFSIG